MHQRGVVSGVPGLYFLGLHFQYALSSSLLGGVGDDAVHFAGHIAGAAGDGNRRSVAAAVGQVG